MSLSKVACAKCVKGVGILACEGCLKKFCMKCTTEHRQELEKELDNIVYEHDTLKQHLQTIDDNTSHPLLKQIDEWKKAAINKINILAEEVHNNVIELLKQNKAALRDRFQKLTVEITNGRDDAAYVETDLDTWMAELEKVKQELITSPSITIEEEKDTWWINKIHIISEFTDLNIPKISVEKFGQVSGNITVEANGQVVIHGGGEGHASVRGVNQYSSGVHCLQFNIDKMQANDRAWIFFGIISVSTPITTVSVTSPTSYGWDGGKYKYVYLNGKANTAWRGYDGDIRANDMIVLTLSCDDRKIQMRNSRTNKKYEIPVDADKCAFPWQLNVVVYHPNDCVRILP